MKKFIPFGVLIFIVILALIFPSIKTVTIANSKIDSGDTAWMLTATALVLIMTPGLAFFYGGMVTKKNVLSIMLQSFVCMGVITYMGNIWFQPGIR
jgi:ammonium transporter, Amt family